MTQTLPPASRRSDVLWSAITAALIVVVYRRIFGVYFLNEDFMWLRLCRFLPGQGLWTLISHDVMIGRYSWRPMVQVSFAVNHALGGLDPFSYRLEVLLWQALAAAAVYALASRFLTTRAAVLAAVIFALHPAQVESLAWTCARGSVMAAAFSLAATHGYLRWRRGGSLLWVAVPFALALGTLETSIALIGVLVAGDVVLPHANVGWRRRLSLYGALLVIVFGFFTLHAYNSPAQMTSPLVGLDRSHPLNLVLPVFAKLRAAAAMALMLSPERQNAAALIFMALAVFALWRWRRGSPLALWGLLWFFIHLAPYSLLFLGPFPRYMPVPLAGFGLLLADAIVCAAAALGRRRWFEPAFVTAFAVLWFAYALRGISAAMPDFERRSVVLRRFLDDLRHELPQPRPGATIGFYRVGDLRVRDGVFVFGLDYAVRVLYDDDSLEVAFRALGDDAGVDYALVYLDGHLRRLGGIR